MSIFVLHRFSSRLAPRWVWMHGVLLAALWAVPMGGCGGGSAKPADAGCTGAACLDMSGCMADTDCTEAGKGRCDSTSGQCVACVVDDDCGAGQHCSAATHACVAGCTAAHGCAPDAGACEVDAGMCVECVSDGDCKDASKPHCDAASHRCGCDPAHDACGHGQYCAVQMDAAPMCVMGCKTDTDCLLVGGGDASVSADGGAADAGSTADGGAPVLTAPYCLTATHQCVQCMADADCPLGTTCQAHQCAPGCTSSHGCAGDEETCCDKTCVDLKSDAAHCGACETACGSSETCCDGSCANTQTDLMNCNTCGYVCSVSNANPKCTGGACGLASCKTGYTDCDGDPANGCEVHTAADVNNCGACGTVCNLQHASSVCLAGTCAIAACDPGWDDCDSDFSDGCEQNVSDNRSNCGGCGITCSDNHINTSACVDGQCSGTCQAPYIDCNGLQADGCECNSSTSYCDGSVCKTQTGMACTSDGQCGGTDSCCGNYCVVGKQTNVNNCGACGVACSTNNIARTCSGGVCNGTCNAGYADCNHNKQADGCEINTKIDSKNCGTCNQVCSNNHVTPVCTNGACNGACLSESAGIFTYYYADCNGNKQADGCETNVSTDLNNCGKCGGKCTGKNTTSTLCFFGSCSNACAAGFGDCNGNGYDGCETNVKGTDANNCGGCGVKCSATNMATRTCSGGVCNGTCAGGTADCNGNKQSDGCETILINNNKNCGACGRACPALYTCTGTRCCLLGFCQ